MNKTLKRLILGILCVLGWPVSVPATGIFAIYKSPKMDTYKSLPLIFSLLVTMILVSQWWFPIFLGIDSIPETPQILGQQNVELSYAQLVRVVDGDTLVVELSGEEKRVRLIGIDAPEVSGEVECLGDDATDYLESLFSTEDIWLQFDPSQGQTDKYDRLLAYVYLENGADVGLKLLERGLASEYTYDKPYFNLDGYIQAQDQARRSQKGIWGEACRCEQKEVSRQCVSCGQERIQYQSWDCFNYVEIVENSGTCSNLCN